MALKKWRRFINSIAEKIDAEHSIKPLGPRGGLGLDKAFESGREQADDETPISSAVNLLMLMMGWLKTD